MTNRIKVCSCGKYTKEPNESYSVDYVNDLNHSVMYCANDTQDDDMTLEDRVNILEKQMAELLQAILDLTAK